MAEKELTVFLLDASVLSSSYKYVFDTLASKLLKGLKTDFVTVATFHSATTNHASAETGKFKGIDILLDFETVTFETLQKLQQKLYSTDILNANMLEESADVVQTVLFALTLFGPTKRKVFTRNILVVTHADPHVLAKSVENIVSIPKFYAEFPVSFNVVVSTNGLAPVHDSILQKITNAFPESLVFTTAEALGLLDVHPPIRKTRPVAMYMGDMRFGSDFARVIDDETYRCENDDSCVSFRVELYPAAKSDITFLDSHEYVVDTQRNIVRLERNTTNFIWEKNFQGNQQTEEIATADPEKQFDKVTVDLNSLTPAFKFSNYDLIALDDDLLQATKLPLFSSFDIFGFIAVSKIPYELFTGESFYIVPEKASSLRNTVSFLAFIEALHVRESAALCRFVRKQGKEVEVGAAFPVKIKCALGYTNCFVFVRLPYKEDEKIGRFPPLTASDEDLVTENDTKKAAAIGLLMDDFVNDKTYESDDDLDEDIAVTKDKSVIENFKVTMKTSENSKLALPPKHKSTNPLLCSSPSANRYQTYMRKILMKSLSTDDWVQHFDSPNFIKENLRDLEDFTNFFNLQNCLTVNSGASNPDWLLKMNEKSLVKSKRLAKELEAGYVRKAETKKPKIDKKATLYQRGNYGADEGTYDEIPEFDF